MSLPSPVDPPDQLSGCYRKITDDIEALFAAHHRGVVVSGPPGSGKTSRLVSGLVAASWFSDCRARHVGGKESPDVTTPVERLGASLVGWHELTANDRYRYHTGHRIKIKAFFRSKLFCRDFHSLAVLLSDDRNGPSRFQEEPARGPHPGEVDLAAGAAPRPRHLLPPPLLLTLPPRPPLALLTGKGPHPWPPPGDSGAP